MRKTNSKGIKLIKKFEGFVPYIYLDCVGLPTIGYGHLCRDNDFYLRGHSVNEMLNLYKSDKNRAERLTALLEPQAETLLKKDLAETEKAVLRLTKVPLNENQFSALVSFVYNLGSDALQRSTLRQKLNRGEYLSVPYEMGKWIYAGGVIRKGLIKRRIAEGSLFLH